MARISVTGMTYAAWVTARNLLIIGSEVRNNILYFKRWDGSEFSAGQVGGIPGPPGSITASPAGGDLTGDYPNPSILDRAVTSAKIALGALNASHMNAVILDGLPNVKSLRSLGTGAQQAAAGNHTHVIPKVYAGLLAHTGSGANEMTKVTYANLWPSGYFTSPPNVLICPDTNVPQNILNYAVSDRSTTGFAITATRSTTATTNFHYVAVQQLP